MIFNTRAEKSFRTAVSSKNVSINKWLRYCPVCAEEDRKKYGEAYWHRTHQLYGVLVCPEHQVFLENSNVNVSSYEKKGSTTLQTLDKDIAKISSPRLLDLSYIQHKHLLMISRFSQDLLSQNQSVMDFENIKAIYRQYLFNAGYASESGIKDSLRLVTDFEKFYTNQLLEEVSCGLGEISRNSWPAGISNANQHTMHPLYHVLMMYFLGYETLQSFCDAYSPGNQYFGPGPWSCENPVCDHYKQEVITQYNLEFRKWPEKNTPYGTFTCDSCGFTYTVCGSENRSKIYKSVKVVETGALWDKKLSELWKDPNANRRTIKETLGYS